MNNSSNAPFTDAQWAESMQSYKDAGFTNVIVQYIAKPLDGTNWALFFPNTDDQGEIFTPPTDRTTHKQDLARILAAAKQSGMTVTVGLGLDEQHWFSTSADVGWTSSSWLAAQAQLAERAAASIWATYGEEFGDTIDGWYLPYEMEGYQLIQGTTAAPEKLDPYITEYLAPVSESVVALSGKSKVMVSPLFTGDTQQPDSGLEPERIKAWTAAWTKVFRETKVSVLAPQDGMGSGKNTLPDVARWFAASKAAVEASGNPSAQLWGNAEIYRDQNASVLNLPVSQISQDLSAMRKAGATNTIMFSAASLEHLPGHGAPDRLAAHGPFYAAYKRWVGGQCESVSKLGAPSAVSAVTGAAGQDADVTAAVNAATTVRVSWGASTTTAPADRVDQQPVGYQVVRDGRIVAEYGSKDGPVATEHVDHQLQPGRTYTYQVWAYDAWGEMSVKPASVQVTIPWTSAALASRDGEAGSFNVARNAPVAVTNREDGVSVGGQGLGPVAPGAELVPSSIYKDEITDPGAIGTSTETSQYAAGPATDGLLGTDTSVDGRWQGQYSSTTHAWSIRVNLTDATTGAGVTVRQLNTQWLRDKTRTVLLPQTITATATDTDGVAHPLGVRSSQDIAGAAPGDAAGQFWFNLTAPTELTNIASVQIDVKSAVAGWLFLGEIQAADSAGSNAALGKPYALTRATTLEYSDGTHSYPGSRAWSLTDGITAPAKGHTDLAWAGRWMGSKTYAPSNGTNAYITLDLGATHTVSDLSLGSYRDTTAAIHTPTSYQTRTAGPDGTWSEWSTATTIPAPANAQRAVLALTPNNPTFRYIQIHLTATTNTILFLDELEAHTTHTGNIALGKTVTNETDCTTGCNATAKTPTLLQTLTAGTPLTTNWNVPSSPWATTNTDNGVVDKDLPRGVHGVTYQVDLGARQPVSEVTATWLEDYDASLMLPSQLTFQYRDSNGEWQTFGTVAGQVSVPQEIPRTAITWTYRATTDTPVTTDAIRVQAHNGSLKPTGTKTATAGIGEITVRTPH